jgi:hypothetical protein
MADLQGIRGYYKARINDLLLFSKYGTPWDFISGAMLIEWIANLAAPERCIFMPPKLERPFVIEAVAKWMPHYKNFEFQTPLVDIDDKTKTTGFYLPLQLWLTLRNPLAHSFTLIPTGRDASYVPPNVVRSYKDLGRPGCILLSHREPNERRGDGGHLALMEDDRCLLRSPDFIEDIDELITACFHEATIDEALNSRILDRFNKRRPVDSLGEPLIIRKGPQY